jgi:hypothetical protein
MPKASQGHGCCVQAFPRALQGWQVVAGVIAALGEAASLEEAVEAMGRLPALFTAALLPQVAPRTWCSLPPFLSCLLALTQDCIERCYARTS